MLKLKLKLHIQPEDSAYCVPYALKSVLEYYGERGSHISFKSLVKGCKSHFRNGTAFEDTTVYLKSVGYKFKRMKFGIKGVNKSLSNNIPVLVSYTTHFDDYHFSIITGTYKQNGITHYMLTDSYFGRVSFPWCVFAILWRDAESWARTVVPIK